MTGPGSSRAFNSLTQPDRFVVVETVCVDALPDRVRTHALMYHDAVSGDPDASGFPGSGPARYKLPWATFLEHLDRIADAVDGPPNTVDDLLDGARRSRWWSLTFDDGGTTALSIGKELARRAWRGHFFATTSLIGEPGFLDASGIRELRSLGHVIGSHSLSHPALMSGLREEDLVHEWCASVASLLDVLGEEVRSASIPGGDYANSVVRAAEKAGISALFTSEPVRTARRVEGCLVIGRLSVRKNTSPTKAARAAAGHPGPWAREYAAWNLRKPLKAIGGERYDRARSMLLEKGSRRRAPGGRQSGLRD